LVEARRASARTRLLLTWSIAALALAGTAVRAQDVTRDPTARRGEIELTYQYSEEQNLETSNMGTRLTPVLTTQSLDFNVRYALKERWTIEGGLPLISRQWGGDGRLPEDPAGANHDPRRLVPPHPEDAFTDDGRYHTYFQDWRLAGRYLLLRDPVIIEPYLMLGFPSTDYPFLGLAVPGEHVKRQEIGSTFAYRPPFLNWFFSVEIGYQYVEKTLGVNKNATRVDAEILYFVNPKIAVKLFASSKNGHGIEPPVPDLTSDIWYHHDQLVRHNYINAGLGADWKLSSRNVVNFSWIQMVHAEDILHLRGALSFSLSRGF
jgi:hypothetical protein